MPEEFIEKISPCKELCDDTYSHRKYPDHIIDIDAHTIDTKQNAKKRLYQSLDKAFFVSDNWIPHMKIMILNLMIDTNNLQDFRKI